MAVYLLPEDEVVFPDPRLGEPDGLLAVGGDYSPERLLAAYMRGIFPWSSEDEPILWWCPRPRMVLPPGEVTVGRSLQKALRRAPYRITMDTAFEAVMRGCAATPRPGQEGTWITEGLIEGFCALHDEGLAHSVEAWEGEALVGGLYGLAIGRVFCGESMFARRPDASKIAFVTLARHLCRWGFELIDCQQATDHLRRFGGREIALEAYLGRLEAGLRGAWRTGRWAVEAEG